MRRRLRRFLAVGLAVTLIDIAVFAALGSQDGWTWFRADAVAVVVAAAVSFLVHRLVTFQDDAYALIDHQPVRFALAALPALVTDVVVIAVVTAAVDVGLRGAVAAKALAVGCAALVRLLTYRRVLFSAVRGGQATPRAVGPAPGDLRASIILPAYQAADIVADSIERVRHAVASLSPRDGDAAVEIVLVDDGSSDDTSAIARAAGADQVITLPENRGKGAAVRAGMLAGRGRTLVFTDIDLAYPPLQLIDIVERVEEGWDVVVGNRRHPDTRTVNSAGVIRELGSLGFNLITMFVLLGNYRDTQCGLKGFRSDVARAVFSQTFIGGFAFDVEVLHLTERFGFSLSEAAVVLDHVEASTVRLVPQAVRMLRDVLRVRRASATGRYVVVPPAPLSAGDGS